MFISMIKKTIVWGSLLLIGSLISYTFAVQVLTIACPGGGSVTVSNVPDSMTYTDLNEDYRCPRGGGVWLVASWDVQTDLWINQEDKGTGENQIDLVIDSTGTIQTQESSVEIQRMSGSLVAVKVQDAIDYLHINWLTKFNTEATFMASASLRRDEAAAFFARFARDVLGMVPDTTKTECSAFTDTSLWHTDLQSEMIAACQLGLFKWFNGKFMPTDTLTNAQALTVLVRLIDGVKSEAGVHRAIQYHAAAKAAWLTAGLMADSETNLDANISRGDVAKLIEAASVYQKNKIEHSGDPHE